MANNSDLPPGLEGNGYAAGVSSQLRPGPANILQPPVVGALRPTVVPTTFNPMDLVARARDRFLSLFQPTVQMQELPRMQANLAAPLPLAVSRTSQLEGDLNALERRSTRPSIQDLRMQAALANAR